MTKPVQTGEAYSADAVSARAAVAFVATLKVGERACQRCRVQMAKVFPRGPDKATYCAGCWPFELWRYADALGTRRPGWDSYFLKIAAVVSERATCTRRKVGSVLVRENRILTTGYNGSPPGQPHCTDGSVGCKMDEDGRHCVRTIHAELNALSIAARHGVSTVGATLYLTTNPCVRCANALLSAGIARVVLAAGDYQDVKGWTGTEVLRGAGVPVEVAESPP